MMFSIRDQFDKVCRTKSSNLALQFQYIPDAIRYVFFFRHMEAGAVVNMLLLTDITRNKPSASARGVSTDPGNGALRDSRMMQQ